MCGYKGIALRVYLITANLGQKNDSYQLPILCESSTLTIVPEPDFQQALCYFSVSEGVTFKKKVMGKGSGKVKFWEYQLMENKTASILI